MKIGLGSQSITDRNDNTLTVTDANGHTTGFAYDPAGRQLEVIYPDAARTQTQYDALGRRTQVTDQAGYSTQYQYDAVGNLTAVIDALGQVTRYAYDEQLSFNFEVQFQAML